VTEPITHPGPRWELTALPQNPFGMMGEEKEEEPKRRKEEGRGEEGREGGEMSDHQAKILATSLSRSLETLF